MSKINNKSISLGLKILVILAFVLGLSLAMPAYAARQNGAFPYPYNSAPMQYTYPTYNYPVYTTPIYTTQVYTTPVYTSPMIIEGCEGRNTGFSTINGQSCIGNFVAPAPATTATNNSAATPPKETGVKSDTSASDVNDNYGSLTANALFGSDSFMPSGLMQWIFFAALIAIMIFLWRYIHHSEEKYMSDPMKHA